MRKNGINSSSTNSFVLNGSTNLFSVRISSSSVRIGNEKVQIFHSKQTGATNSPAFQGETRSDKTGLHVWPAAKLLANYLFSLGNSYAPTIVEMGAGTGVVGLSALKNGICDKILMLDQDPLAVELLQRNIVANGVEGRAEALQLDWCDEEAVSMVLENHVWAPFSVIVASDVIYPWGKKHVIEMFFSSAKRLMDPSGGEILMSYARRQNQLCTKVMFNAVQEAKMSTTPLPTGPFLGELSSPKKSGRKRLCDSSNLHLMKFCLAPKMPVCEDLDFGKDLFVSEAEVWCKMFPDLESFFHNHFGIYQGESGEPDSDDDENSLVLWDDDEQY